MFPYFFIPWRYASHLSKFLQKCDKLRGAIPNIIQLIPAKWPDPLSSGKGDRALQWPGALRLCLLALHKQCHTVWGCKEETKIMTINHGWPLLSTVYVSYCAKHFTCINSFHWREEPPQNLRSPANTLEELRFQPRFLESHNFSTMVGTVEPSAAFLLMVLLLFYRKML